MTSDSTTIEITIASHSKYLQTTLKCCQMSLLIVFIKLWTLFQGGWKAKEFYVLLN